MTLESFPSKSCGLKLIGNTHRVITWPTKMLSRTSLRFLRFAFRTSSFWNFCPYVWDNHRSQAVVSHSKRKIALFYVNVILLALYEIYLLCRIAQLSLSPDTKVSEMVKVSYNAVLYMLPIAVQYNIICRRREIPAFVNGYLAIFERFKGLSLSFINQHND